MLRFAAQLLLDGEATALTRKAVELALAGDPTVLGLCLDRTVAPRRDRSVVESEGLAAVLGGLALAAAIIVLPYIRVWSKQPK